MTSDHFPISGIVPSCTQSINKSKGPLRVPKDKLLQFAQLVSPWMSRAQDLKSKGDTEQLAQDLCRALKDALKAVGKVSNGRSGRSAPWWTPECKAVRLQYRTASTEPDRNQYAKAYRNTIAAAKRKYWKSQVEDMKSPSDIYRLIRWAKPRHIEVPPPLLYIGRLVSDQAERALVLRDSLLARLDATDDLPIPTINAEIRILWTEGLEEIEVRLCTIGSGNTCPGTDRISVELLSICWDTLGPCVIHLLRSCLKFGYHPSCFKLAEVVFIPKAGRDPSSAKGWRPIALPACLGKGLERIIAKRIATLAITAEVDGHQQFGALPKRSATDFVACVVHDTEEARI
ncbi:hypothetical protein K3495_g2460 [Podosphaera aphanis]|nr:hypothetical protein K3495_g2460 [Podosphaera aphanis]